MERKVMMLMAGAMGAGGVAAAAAASHLESSRTIAALATIALAHAPVLLILAERLKRGRLIRLAAWVLAIGAAGFVLDMAIRTFLPDRMPGFAAPVFGAMMMLGWVGTGIFGVAEKH
ncbi:hypothetical protein GCM10007989_08100 [Devosia pacifica]|uniref:DUF423 domain-containing protein n=1 Tax=Devosia pacifica TaxID=1335967 RepID=A0A918RWU2_9HYPH|nr:DUF423 domain-containing protein [Devosia pacifica]GHA15696.1 hypothetical protein GCM10007989_08100 [Devosia pacifica]